MEHGLDPDTEHRLKRFIEQSSFGQTGAVMTDLDGTAVHEHQGRITIPLPVEHGMKRIRDLGRPLILNSLRFPLSVMRSFGQEWYAISDAPLPTVSLNGALTGYITRSDSGVLAFEEIDALPLATAEIDAAIARVAQLFDEGLHDLLVFHYPRDIDEKRALLDGYGIEEHELLAIAPAIPALNLLNYAPTIRQAFEDGDQAELAHLRLRLAGTYDLYGMPPAPRRSSAAGRGSAAAGHP